MKKRGFKVFALAFALVVSIGCASSSAKTSLSFASAGGKRNVRIISISDTNGKFMPYDYAQDSDSKSGSLVQLSSAISSVRDDNTLVIDLGDEIQGNLAELFVSDDPKMRSPMADFANYIRYDAWVPGNHEFNYGMNALRNYMAQLKSDIVCANVYDEGGKRIGKPYVIKEANGVRVAIIGIVTPNIMHWDSRNLEKCKVTSPLDEIPLILDEIRGKYDVLVLAAHAGINSEYGVKGSGVTDIANAFPEFDIALASHEHSLVEGMSVSNALVTENMSDAQTLSVIDIVYDVDSGRVDSKTSKSIRTSSFEPDEKLLSMFEKYDEAARKESHSVIGRLEDGPLSPEDEIKGITSAKIMSTRLVDLINDVQLYYSGAQISAAALFKDTSNWRTGKIMKKNLADIYLHSNTLYKVRIKGWQLKKYMEWSAGYFNQLGPDDLTVSFNPEMRGYLYDMFAGVDYDIDISQPAGNRIRNLVLSSNKQPIRDDEEYTIALNNYRATSQVCNRNGGIFGPDDEIPVIEEIDIRGDIGGVREMIGAYVAEKSVDGVFVAPPAKGNWKLVGINWNRLDHDAVVRAVRDGKLSVVNSADGRMTNIRSFTKDDLKRIR